MKNTRKNPFGNATPYTGPSMTTQSQWSSEISEDPDFNSISKEGAPFQTRQSQGPFKNTNQFGDPNAYGAQEDYSDFNPPAQNFQQNSWNADFGNSGWKTGAPIKNPFGQDDVQQNYANTGYDNAEAQMYDAEPPLLEGMFLTSILV